MTSPTVLARQAWLNGQFLAVDAVNISPTDRGFLLGDGLFETLRADNNHIQCLNAHLNRLIQSAKLLRIPFDPNPIPLAINTLLEKLQAPCAAIRITLTRGLSRQRGLALSEATPTLLITAEPYTPPTQPWRAMISNWRRSSLQPYARLKQLHYQPSIQALFEAQSHGYDEAIMLNEKGDVVCSSRGNLFIQQNGCIKTPPIASGALPGVMRAKVLNDFKAQGQTVIITTLAPQDLHICESAFITNSLIGLQPVLFT